MSKRNVEIAERVADAFNRGDIEAALADIDAEVDFIPRRAPVQGAYRGHDGVREFFADNAENFDLFRFDAKEIRDLGDRVLATGKLVPRGKQSGAEVSVPEVMLLTFRDGKIVRFEDFSDRPDELAALGLPS